ncbi:hypothetical protein PhCBS80983_g03431 [Powellomyces hirtus]|uniref:Glycosyl transferase family 1 domain-containing protein n=1 Tax=Powellomyces hirtus TaxID=109895 RepID=A0A507E2F9_9FUNG|nr:hypothetical protein PhCBS80983_g03431 [Powellomyces hirtus]
MRIFLIQSAYGLFASSGGYRANLAFCRAMVDAGHQVKMVAFPYKADLESLASSSPPSSPTTNSKNGSESESITMGSSQVPISRFEYKGIQVVGLDADAYSSVFDDEAMKDQYAHWLEDEREVDECVARKKFIHGEMQQFEPTHCVMNERGSLKIAMDDKLPCKCVRVFIAHDVNNLPFGPFSATGPSKAQHDRLRNVEGLWTVSEAVKAYFTQFGQLHNAKVLPNHPYIFADDPDSLPFYDNWSQSHVTLINPGPAKGFLLAHALARLAPDVHFLVIKSWAMQPYVVSQFQHLPNVTVEPAYIDTEQLWAKTKVLVVPSVCYEAFGLVVVEALLRGIPVISSDAGGLPEAHLGVPWVLPVTPVSEKETEPELVDKFGEWKLPENDPEPWVLTLHSALWDQALYEQVRVQGRSAALAYLAGLDTEKYERWFADLADIPGKDTNANHAAERSHLE